MNAQIRELIAKYEKHNSFTHMPLTDSIIQEAKADLGNDIPAQFVEFLNSYSHGGIGGIEILGIGFDGSAAFLEETMEYREEGLPDNLLVVEYCDEWLYCIDCKTDEVVSWSIDGEMIVEYPSFDDYLFDRLNDAIENL